MLIDAHSFGLWDQGSPDAVQDMPLSVREQPGAAAYAMLLTRGRIVQITLK